MYIARLAVGEMQAKVLLTHEADEEIAFIFDAYVADLILEVVSLNEETERRYNDPDSKKNRELMAIALAMQAKFRGYVARDSSTIKHKIAQLEASVKAKATTPLLPLRRPKGDFTNARASEESLRRMPKMSAADSMTSSPRSSSRVKVACS